MKKIAVVGGGVAGLTVAYRLSQAGHKVTLFEADKRLGGLAQSFLYEVVNVERYYHFICRPDYAYLDFIKELGLEGKLKWHYTRMGYFFEGKHYPFGTPFSLINFKPLSLMTRLRFGIHTLESKRVSSWADLDEVPAKDWLIEKEGYQAYEVIWKPLLELKFGDKADKISAAWIWARINRVANSREGLLLKEKLGYLKGGTETLIKELTHRIEGNGGDVRLEAPVEEIVIEGGRARAVRARGTEEEFDVIASTIAAPLFLKLAAKGLPADYAETLAKIEYYGVACWLILSKERLTENFWLNVHDSRITFPGVIEYTNLNPMPELGGLHVLYIPYYMSTSDPRFLKSKEELLPGLIAELELIKPGFSKSIENILLFKDSYAQPVFYAGYHRMFAGVSDPKTPVKGLFRTDMSQIYPDDRSLVNAIDKGNLLSKKVVDEM